MPFPEIPFKAGDPVIDRANPGRPAIYTGKFTVIGDNVMVTIQFPDGSKLSRLLSAIQPMAAGACDTIDDRVANGQFGCAHDLRRLVTFEKLRGSLNEVIYSMDAAQIDFYPYQFKPVMKFIASPTSRLLIADEVGLGKTIESALIWLELQARRQAKRLLVVCPNILAPKWCDELRSKFQLDARQVNFAGLADEIARLRTEGPSHSFVLVATYTGLRPPKSELKLLDDARVGDQPTGSPKTEFLMGLRNWEPDFLPFDMVVFDEAHYMRNTSTTTHHLGRALAHNRDTAVLCVSATPVSNKSRDLLSLLRLVDESVFSNQTLFDEFLAANRPAVRVMNALSRTPLDRPLLDSSMADLRRNPKVTELPLFDRLAETVASLRDDDAGGIAACQDLAEKLNLLGSYINRTRRVQVAENRPVRTPRVLAVEYAEQERRLYDAILALVRARCAAQGRSFHVFAVMGLQLRAASCLPAFAAAMRANELVGVDDVIAEALGDDILEGVEDGDPGPQQDLAPLALLMNYDYEKHDTKYEQLRGFLLDRQIRDEKVIIFAFFRGTLAYLRRRLVADGISVTEIHGGVPLDDRWQELARFRDPHGPRVLLSSEVGSEGIDLQFCSTVVNYDLPWNPMRVEQRIGRVDRVNQKAARIRIVNFKVRNTIEERLYERLHEKLMVFSNSLGDLEELIGKEVQELTLDLLSRNLTEAEQNERIAQTERVIAERARGLEDLETSGETLVALSDYVQHKIEENRGYGRYLQATELAHYIIDFFEHWFPSTIIDHEAPGPGCLTINLSGEAYRSLQDHLAGDTSLGARPLRNRRLVITFSSDARKALADGLQRQVSFVNHLSPLVRWVTATIDGGGSRFHNVSAIRLRTAQRAPGTYCYSVERWQMKGRVARESLAFGVADMHRGQVLLAKDAEALLNEVLQMGRDWDRARPSPAEIAPARNAIVTALDARFGAAVTDFDAENRTSIQIKRQRVEAFYGRLIGHEQQRLESLRVGMRTPNLIRASQAKIEKHELDRDEALERLERTMEVDPTREEIAAGIFIIES